MSLEITGKVSEILPKESGTGKNGNEWVKQSFVIETEGQYPKKVCFTAWRDLVNQVGSLPLNSEVKVFFDVESRAFNGKWYSDIKAWKIEAKGSVQQERQNVYTQQTPQAEPLQAEAEGDDLPF